MILSRRGFKGARCLSFDCSSFYDSSEDRYVEAMIVSLVDYFVLNPFSGSRVVATCHTMSFFPSSFLFSLAFRVALLLLGV